MQAVGQVDSALLAIFDSLATVLDAAPNGATTNAAALVVVVVPDDVAARGSTIVAAAFAGLAVAAVAKLAIVAPLALAVTGVEPAPAANTAAPARDAQHAVPVRLAAVVTMSREE